MAPSTEPAGSPDPGLGEIRATNRRSDHEPRQHTRHRTAKLHLHPDGTGTVELDGRELSGVRGLTLNAGVDQTPTLALSLLIDEVTTETETRVVMPERTRETLIALGWTPPEEEP